MSEQQAKYDIERAKKETAAIQKYAAIKATGEDTIAVSKVYVDMTGDIYAALILDELMFWTVPNKRRGQGLRVKRDGYLWLAVNRSEWWERKRLTERQADTAVQKLIDLGLVEKKIMLFNAKTTPHLRIIPARFFELYGQAMQEYLQDAEPDERQEIADLYEMMGMEKPAFYESVKPELQNGKTYVLQNRDSINSPTLTNSNGAKNAPQESPKKPMTIEWQIASSDKPVVLLTADEEFRAKVDLAVMGIARYGQDLAALADAFISTRKIFPSKKDLRGWAGVLREMKSQGVTAEHITQAVNKLVGGGMTVADPWAVKKTALDMANKIKVEQPEPEGILW